MKVSLGTLTRKKTDFEFSKSVFAHIEVDFEPGWEATISIKQFQQWMKKKGREYV